MFSEQDVERELEAALAVSPSPDFEARVLQRVAADRPSHWRAAYGWMAAAASVIIAAGLFYALNGTSAVVAPPSPTQVVEQAPRIQKNIPQPPRVHTVRAQRSAPQRALRTPPRTGEPEIIVPVNQMDAVRRLVRAVNEGRIEAPAEPRQGPMAPPETLAIVPIVVEPISVSPVAPEAETPAPSIRSLK